MSVPQTASSQGTTDITMSEFDGTKKEMDVTITSVDGNVHRPVLGRRKTTNELCSGTDEQSLGDDHEEDGLTKFGNLLW